MTDPAVAVPGSNDVAPSQAAATTRRPTTAQTTIQDERPVMCKLYEPPATSVVNEAVRPSLYIAREPALPVTEGPAPFGSQ